jgi:hypothetical protein
MSWIEVVSSLGIGGSVGVILGAIAALTKARPRFDQLIDSIRRIAPQHQKQIQAEFDAFWESMQPVFKLFKK